MMDTGVQSLAHELAQSPHETAIRQLILDRCGLFFRDHEYNRLDSMVCKRMAIQGMSDFCTYVHRLRHSEEEFRELLHLLTVHHTYFFRNELHFRALQQRVLPSLVKAKQTHASTERPTLRLWSAGCASGEEPYSLAMAACDAIPDGEDWDVTVLATDVSMQVLAGAQSGLFGSGSMQLVSAQQQRRYFDRRIDSTGKSQYRVKDSLRRRVQFRYLNLLEASFPSDIDIIFCRNVMGYFNQEIMQEVVRRFHHSLRSPGYLFIGYAQTVQGFSSDVQLTPDPDGIFYQKMPAQGGGASLSGPAHGDTIAPVHTPSVPALAHRGSLLRAIHDAAHHQDSDRSLQLIQQVDPQSAEALEAFYEAAYIHTNRGAYPQAHRWLDRVLALDASFAPAHFLLGMVLIEENRNEEAQTVLHKALYLDPDFPMVHMALATSYHRQHQRSEALGEYQRAVKILSLSPPEQELHHAGGFKYRTLLDICHTNIERLQNGL
jgi:chemotaxis protein methyltransferase CheR